MKIAIPLVGAVVLVSTSLIAAALDLSRPGALDRLKAHRPAHYEAVAEIARLGERASCDPRELEAVKPPVSVDRLDCGNVGLNNGISQRRMKFEIEGTEYSLTVRVKDTAPRLIGR